MLSEGWDTRTVTHIMGLRAFTSQLLCEQVVGRGLRRTSYEIDGNEDEMFLPEYVNVFGVPFNFLLFGADDESEPMGLHRPEKPKFSVRSLPERREFAISWPDVERLEYVMSQKLSLNVGEVPELVLDAGGTRISAELAPVLDGKTDLTKCLQVELESLYGNFRLQQIIFAAAGKVYDSFSEQWQNEGMKLSQIGQVIALTEKYLASVRIKPAVFAEDEVRRAIVLAMNMERIISHIWRHITSENVERIIPVLPQGRKERSTEDMREWWTTRPNFVTKKSQINRCVFDSTWESGKAYALDNNPAVKAWAKNDHLGFSVSYMYGGTVRRYVPDFLVKLTNGKTLIFEVKGVEFEQDRVKKAALLDWVKAVNGVKVFGEWACEELREPGEVDGIIARYA
jgi:type III restriction enzyme